MDSDDWKELAKARRREWQKKAYQEAKKRKKEYQKKDAMRQKECETHIVVSQESTEESKLPRRRPHLTLV